VFKNTSLLECAAFCKNLKRILTASNVVFKTFLNFPLKAAPKVSGIFTVFESIFNLTLEEKWEFVVRLNRNEKKLFCK